MEKSTIAYFFGPPCKIPNLLKCSEFKTHTPEHWSWVRICVPSNKWSVILEFGLMQRIKFVPFKQFTQQHCQLPPKTNNNNNNNNVFWNTENSVRSLWKIHHKTCHMAPHNVNCHPTENNVTSHNPSQTATQKGCKAELIFVLVNILRWFICQQTVTHASYSVYSSTESIKGTSADFNQWYNCSPWETTENFRWDPWYDVHFCRSLSESSS